MGNSSGLGWGKRASNLAVSTSVRIRVEVGLGARDEGGGEVGLAALRGADANFRPSASFVGGAPKKGVP